MIHAVAAAPHQSFDFAFLIALSIIVVRVGSNPLTGGEADETSADSNPLLRRAAEIHPLNDRSEQARAGDVNAADLRSSDMQD